jgi:hypothetical protein
MAQALHIAIKELKGSRLERDVGEIFISHEPPDVEKYGP